MHHEVGITVVPAAGDDPVPACGHHGRDMQLERRRIEEFLESTAMDDVEFQAARGTGQRPRGHRLGHRSDVIARQRPVRHRDNIDVTSLPDEIAENGRAVKVDAEERFAKGCSEPLGYLPSISGAVRI
jgi:hypothetical protein